MITIGRYRFEGPVYNKHALKNAPGVYGVLDGRGTSGYSVLDIGESEDVRARIAGHDRETCWHRNARGRVCYASLYSPGSTAQQRQVIEHELRQKFAPACGVR